LKEMLYLDFSKKIADSRHKLIQNFYDQIKEELK
jgi:hypothetical protein